MTIKYDTPIEVTKEQYQFIMGKFSGAVAGRQDGDKYFIKVWVMYYANIIKAILK